MKKSLFLIVTFLAILLTSCQIMSPSQEPTNRTVTVQNVSGTVELMVGSKDKPHTPIIGETISIGTEIRTGTDGQIVLESDDGTIVLITTNSSFRLTVLKGTAESPLTRFLAIQGEIFAFRLKSQVLPPNSGFEVETPNGTMVIRGSSMGVSFLNDDSNGEASNNTTTLVCMTGICIAESKSGQTMELKSGQKIEITTTGITGSVMPLTEEDIKRQIDALQVVQDAGGEKLSVDISYYNNETGGETEIAVNQEYIAITRPGCWATPEEAWAMKTSVATHMSVYGNLAPFIGYGPTAECLPGGVSTGTYNYGAYFVIGPFTTGDYTIETLSIYDGNEESTYAEVCILHAR